MIALLIDFILDFVLLLVRRRVVSRVQQHALKAYLQGVRGARRFLLFAMAVVLFFQMMIFGFFSLLAGILLWAPWSSDTKAFVLIGLSAIVFLIPMAILAVMMSERVWYRASGAEAMFEQET
jgi:hypothetical protein